MDRRGERTAFLQGGGGSANVIRNEGSDRGQWLVDCASHHARRYTWVSLYPPRRLARLALEFHLTEEKTALKEDQPITLRLRGSPNLLLGLAESCLQGLWPAPLLCAEQGGRGESCGAVSMTKG